MVQLTGGAPADGATTVTAQPHQPTFPVLPPPPQVPHVAQVAEMFVDPKAQLYPESAGQLYPSAAAQLYTEGASQLYPEAASQLYPEASSQLYPEAASQMFPVPSSPQSYASAAPQFYPEATSLAFTDATPQAYPVSSPQPFANTTPQLYGGVVPHLCGDPSSPVVYPSSPQPYADSAPPVFPVSPSHMYNATSQLYAHPTPQVYPDATPQLFVDPKSHIGTDAGEQVFNSGVPQLHDSTVPQVFADNSAPLVQNPFTATEQFAPVADNFQQAVLGNISTLPSYGPVDTVPSTSAVVFSALIPEYSKPSSESVLDNNNPFELVNTPAVVSSDLIPEYNPTSPSPGIVLDNSNPFDFVNKTSEETVLDNNNPFEMVSKPVEDAVLDNSNPFEVVSSGHSTFQVIPVVDVTDYSDVDNARVSVSSESLDSCKGSEMSTMSDVYMNSDYTDTVDSTTFLLAAKRYTDDADSTTDKEEVQETVSEERTDDATPTAENAYSNEAFCDFASSTVAEHRSDDLANDIEGIPRAEEAKEGNENYNWIQTVNSAVYSGESAQLAVDQEVGAEVAETERVLHEAPDCVESLVHQLAEQHPAHVVALHVEVLRDPVYQPLTEPIWEDEEDGWMNSQESLNQYHQYKNLKQGRQGAVLNPNEHKSFLNITAASVTSLGQVCQRALGYVRADMEFGSIISLPVAEASKHPSLLSVGSGQPPAGWEALSSGIKKKTPQPAVKSARHMRNLIFISLVATILLISLNATRNLQSSLNQKGGVGITSLAISFTGYTLGSLISPVVVQKLGVRLSIIFGLVLQLVYVATNLYPVMWLMAPSSAGGGISLAIIWNAVSTYIVMLARGEALYKNMQYERVSDKFFGIFCLIYQCNLVVGNLISSLIITFGDSGKTDPAAAMLLNETLFNSTSSNLTNTLLFGGVSGVQAYTASNDSITTSSLASDIGGFGLGLNGSFDATIEPHYHLCGSNFCHHFSVNQAASAVSSGTKYLLFGIFMFLILLAILIAVVLLEPLCLNLAAMATQPWKQVKRQVVSLVRFSRNTRFLLLLPLLFYSNMQFSFVCSEVMMAFVTCPVGVWLVGYTMMVYGFTCGVASYLTQAFIPRTGRTFFIVTASAINLGLLLFMRLWQPHPDSMAPLFVITGLFGFADGIWNVNANGLMGSVFPEHYEEAFTGLRVAQGLGGALTMAYAPFLCMAYKIYIMLGCTATVFCCYLGADFLIRRDRKNKPAATLYEKETA